MKFRVAKGSFYENHRLYLEGEVFTSEKNLAKAFPGEIVEVKDVPPKEEKKAEPPPSKKEAPSTSSTAPDAKGEKDPEPSKAPAKKVLKKMKLNGPTSDERGELMNSRFDFDPKKAGVNVFRRGGKYFIYSVENSEDPLNKVGLVREKVLDFVKSHKKG